MRREPKDTRLIALIEESTMKALLAQSKKLDVSLAEVVRRAIAEYLAKAAK
jgi:hypothetical protein